MDMEIHITPEMKKMFAAETTEHLDLLEQMLLKLETGPFDSDTFNAAFRAVHSIKGNSDYMGMSDINGLSNALEDLMDDIRGRKRQLTDNVMAVLFTGLDRLREINRRVTQTPYTEADISDLLGRISALKHELPLPEKEPASERPPVDITAVFAKTSRQHCRYLSQQAQKILAGNRSGKTRENIERILKTFFISANYAGFSVVAQQIQMVEDRVTRAKSIGNRLAADILGLVETIENQIHAAPADTPGPAPQQTESLSSALSEDIMNQDLRLSPGRVDELMRRASELAIAVSGLTAAADSIAGLRLSEDQAEQIRRAVTLVNRNTSDVYDMARTIGLVRMDALFDRLPRIVRDLSLKFGKKIEIVTMGGDTQIDRKVIERLVDPMIHLIRNAVDHGIESPEDRTTAGKPAQGTITVKAVQEGNLVGIDIVDDGRGIDMETVKQAAARHLYPGDILDQMTPENALNLVFTPGFSTADAGSTVSGRGVGLDIVRSNLRTVGGNVTLSSEKGRATRFRLHVPVSMAAVEVLLVEAGGEIYAMPISCILETRRISPKDIQLVNGKETIAHNNSLIAVERLKDRLDPPGDAGLSGLSAENTLSMLVITFGGDSKGIIVDTIVRRESIIVKPLERHFEQIDEFSGAALMGDGTIILLLDPHGLV